ncbi:iron-containing redox enzyme family protein [Kitasatospora sp. MBT63]|uniref:iron-containing redox enzyme family protein n=1 Tax=Kitasatospora sp. MBT63 TaxID=1444768 RepID=UPI00068FCEDF|nr:iron-containing redox enzyme family protein [Kitasatospora sp. MBT63]
MGITTEGHEPDLPPPRGPLTGYLTGLLAHPPGASTAGPYDGDGDGDDPWGDDHQLALYVCYELRYRGFARVDPEWEWEPRLLALQRRLEDGFLAALRAAAGPVAPLAEQLTELLVEPLHGTGPSHFLLDEGERWQAREYLVHRSVYHLKEADPQAWVIPRLHGAAQAALVAVEHDEYGGGRGDRAHSRLFAEMMVDFGLDARYGSQLDAVPAPGLAIVNMMTLFGLRRSLRGASVGQFAAVEVTSSPGAARLAKAFERLGAGPAGTRFYREHVEADAVHEQLVRRGVIAALLEDEPDLEADIAFGVAATTLVEERLAAHLLAAWRDGRSSLRAPPANAPGVRAG